MSLLELYPDWARTDPVFCAIQAALEPSVAQLTAYVEDCKRQATASTATWGLELWERAYGLPTDPGLSLEARRARVVARINTGGTSTWQKVLDVVAVYYDDYVSIQTSYKEVVLRFWGLEQLPPSADEIERAVREIMPAHLHLQLKAVSASAAEAMAAEKGRSK